MKDTQISCILMITFLLMAGSYVMASDFRCGSKIITIGNYKYDVLRNCGKPSHVEFWEEVRHKRDFGSGLLETEIVLDRRWLPFVQELLAVEKWGYNLGSNRFIRYLRFENGRLVKIIERDYGY